MTLYDSSLLIGYLDGDDGAVDYVEAHSDDRAVAPPIVLFEVYQGEVFGSGVADFDAVRRALTWLTVVETTDDVARTAADLQETLHRRGEVLTARDAFIAGTAAALDEPLAVSDGDFDVDGLAELVDVDFV